MYDEVHDLPNRPGKKYCWVSVNHEYFSRIDHPKYGFLGYAYWPLTCQYHYDVDGCYIIEFDYFSRDPREEDETMTLETVVEETKENEEKKANVVALHLVTGGNDGSGDWLSPLPVGTRFLARTKNLKRGDNPFVLTMYQVAWAGDRARQLLVYINMFQDRPDETVVIAVDPARFCTENSKFEILKELDVDDSGSDPEA